MVRAIRRADGGERREARSRGAQALTLPDRETLRALRVQAAATRHLSSDG